MPFPFALYQLDAPQGFSHEEHQFAKPQFRDLKATESILRPGFSFQGQLCPVFHVFQDDFILLVHKKAARAMTQTALKPSFGMQR